MIEIYGKPSGPLLTLKKSFIEENDEFLEKSQKIDRIYSQQARRVRCKNCDHVLDTESFSKQGVVYGICTQCGHLNGFYQDTKEFCSSVYTDDDGDSYALNYSSQSKHAYEQRVVDIYMPKAEFLRDTLNQLGETPTNLAYSDFGAGSGYYVSALIRSGLTNTVGYEVSGTQVSLGNAMMNNEYLIKHSLKDTVDLAGSIDADVVSMIGVLEHVQNPREILRALQQNPKVRFLYISVPLFSPCVFFEMVFPTVMQRQLSAGHTHLYTESSLKWLTNEFSMHQVAAWWFGTDMVDLFRNVAVRLEQQPETINMVETWVEMFTPLIDVMQREIDKKHLASEVHMLLKFED
jgi:hypothetical protein